jgi:glycine dehydrogenase subunit 1
MNVKNEMLKEIGLNDIEELFSDIPEKIKIEGLDLPKSLSQKDVMEKLREISKDVVSFYDMPSFLGGGIKQHFVPPVVKEIVSRSEFFTSYTPYQAEASQGMLQSMFEYQSIICELTGMDVANCSLYDGATALGEAALMCSRIKNDRTKFIVARNVSWEKRNVLNNYIKGTEIRIVEAPFDKDSGKIDLNILSELVDKDVCGLYVENPNFFGVFESEVKKIADIAHEKEALLVVGVDPISLGIVRSPGEFNADIVIGEGRALGNEMCFGGSSLGIFACRNEYLRQIPGRVIGATKDKNGKRAFCMTLQTREQHIRRGRATSNICTNEGLNALAAVVYLSWLGGVGLWELASINIENARKCLDAIVSIDGFSRKFSGEFFNEFVIESRFDVNELNKKLFKKGIIGGLDISKWYPELENCLLFGVTEMHSDEMINRLTSALREVVES